MQKSLPSRTVLNHSDLFLHNLSMYALTAAALVGFLSFAKPTQAKVVYTQTNVSVFGNGVIDVDLNHDGIIDFTIKQSFRSIGCRLGDPIGYLGKVTIVPAHGAAVVASGTYALALKSGVQIDSGQTFYGAEAVMLDFDTCFDGYNRGYWYQAADLYLGLTGKAHYGWAQLTVYYKSRGTRQLTTTLSGFAYETIRDRGIKTGQTQDDLGASPDSPDPNNTGTDGTVPGFHGKDVMVEHVGGLPESPPLAKACLGTEQKAARSGAPYFDIG